MTLFFFLYLYTLPPDRLSQQEPGSAGMYGQGPWEPIYLE